MKNEVIKFTIIDDDQKQIVKTHVGAYPNLMKLLKDKLYLDEFGECGGVGRCATCVVKVKGVLGKSAVKDRNEPETLIKLGFKEANIRLSCQIFITKDLQGAEIEIYPI